MGKASSRAKVLDPSVRSAFLTELLGTGALKFGSFKTKSGRISPYFIDFGRLDSGLALHRVAECYAALIEATWGDSITCLFGPAYKGIPLAVMTSQVFGERIEKPVGFCFNRKERKDHGEGGTLVGYVMSPKDRVLVIEDVLTGGTSLRETWEMLQPLNIKPVGVVLGIDRREKGLASNARDEIESLYGCEVASLFDIREVLETLAGQPVAGRVWVTPEQYRDAQAYLTQWSMG